MGFTEIKKAVEENGNVKTFTAEELRNAYGAHKLGSQVRHEISRALAGEGLGHVPALIPSYQHELVRVYKRGTAVGDLVESILTPSEQNDQFIVEKGGETSTDYLSIVKQIRELVNE